MDLSRLAQDVLAYAGEEQAMAGSLADAERRLREVLGRIGQAALQLHVSQDQRRGYEGSSRLCTCGKDQKFVGHRLRTIESLLGPVTFSRAYYHCQHCGAGCVPFDQKEGLGALQVSVPLAQVVVELTDTLPFRQAHAKLEVLLGRQLSASSLGRITCKVGSIASAMEEEAAAQVQQDRSQLAALEAGRLYIYADGAMVHHLKDWLETKALQCRWQDAQGHWHARHLCRNEKVPAFDALAWACMHSCGLDNARQSVLLGDGIAWIWNHLGPLADEAVQILDWYHAKEHLSSLAKALEGDGTLACQQLLKELESLLWESRHQELVALLQDQKKRLRSVPKREAIDDLLGYLAAHQSRMDYKKYREMGLEVGSGPIEGDCKNLIHARMKCGSPRWSDQGCQAMLSLRCCHANDQRDALWIRKPLLAA
jgi:hypothetical protein